MERRRSERLRLRARAWCEATGLTLYGRVGNVSETGLFLLSAAPLTPGTRVRVSIPAPVRSAESELHADAEVVWSREPAVAELIEGAADRGASGLALRFLELSGEGRALLAQILAQGGRPA
jgi:hypothetical protein